MIMAVNKNNKSKKKSSENKPEKELSKRQELNNHIVRMRNNVTQARVQIINRLIHQVKKYKARKGSEKEQEKAKRKAERLVEEIQILKKLKKDKASVYALQDSKTLDEVLNDPTSCQEERALSRISHHNVIKKKVNEYREGNPNWDKQIPVLLAMTRAKRQAKKDPTSAESNANQAKSTPSGARILPKKAKPESINGARKIVASGSEGESDGEEPDSPPVKAKPESDKRKKENGSPNPARLPNLNRVEGTVKVKLLSNLNDLESDSDEEDKALLRLTQVPKSTKPKSGFFVGGVDKPEPKSFPTQQNDRYFNQNPNSSSTRNNSHQPKDVYRKGKLVSKPNFKPKPDFRNKPQRSAHPSHYDANSEPINQNPKRPKFPGNTSDRLLQPPSASNPTSEKLHPSWEAKKKQQQITAFAGKRIVFGDDE